MVGKNSSGWLGHDSLAAGRADTACDGAAFGFSTGASTTNAEFGIIAVSSLRDCEGDTTSNYSTPSLDWENPKSGSKGLLPNRIDGTHRLPQEHEKNAARNPNRNPNPEHVTL